MRFIPALSVVAFSTLGAFGALSLSIVQAMASDRSLPPPPPEVRAALSDCASESGFDFRPESGQRPTRAQHEAIVSCMIRKGFPPPPGRDPSASGGPSDPVRREPLRPINGETSADENPTATAF